MRTWLILSGFGVCLALGGCGDDGAGGEGGADGTGTGMGDGSGPGDAGDDGPQPCSGDAECDNGNDCTVDSCEAGFCAREAVVSNACRPQIDVEFPPRAATVEADSSTVTVRGTVTSPAAGGIASLHINGEAVSVNSDGSFAHDVTAVGGGNTLILEAVDELDVPRKRVQSFLWSSHYRRPEAPPAQIAPEGLAIYLDQESLDDNDRSLPHDDLASVLKLALDAFDVAQFIDATTPITHQADYDVFLTDLALGSTSISLSGIDGGVRLQATLLNIVGDLVFDCTTAFCLPAGGDSTGGLSVTTLGITGDAMLTVGPDNTLDVELTNVQTNLNTSDVDIWSNNIWTNFLITIIEPFILGGVVQDITDELNMQVSTVLGPALASGLGNLSLNTTLEFPNIADADSPIGVDLATDFGATDFHDGIGPPNPSPPRGGAVILRGGGYPTANTSPYDNLGVPSRRSCGEGGDSVAIPRTAPLEFALSDDMLNQLLYAAWKGGLLEFPLPPEIIGDGGGLATNVEVVISGMLAPTASDCGGEFLTHVGDLRVDASLDLGADHITFTAFSTAKVELEITPTEDGIGLSVEGVSQIDTELTVNEDDSIDAEELLTGVLEKQLEDGLVQFLGGGGLSSIAFPDLDLSSQLALPPGTAVLTIQTETVHHEDGTTVVSAHL